MTMGDLNQGLEMPGPRSRFWPLLTIVMISGIPCLAHAIPQADFTYGQQAGYSMYVDGSTSSDPAGIARYTWNFGDGSPELSSPVSRAYHVYSDHGDYPVTLHVTTKVSPPETGTITKTVTIEEIMVVCTPPACPPCTPTGDCFPYTCAPDTYDDCAGTCGIQCKDGPYADFTYTILGANVVRFNASRSIAPQGIGVYTWNFGDGTPEESSAVPLIIHSYSTDGTYYVRLWVHNQADPPGGSSVTKEVTVNWFVCTPPPCTTPGVLACPTDTCPGGCGVECTTQAPLGTGLGVVALAGVYLLHLRRRRGRG